MESATPKNRYTQILAIATWICMSVMLISPVLVSFIRRSPFLLAP
ncbi:MAG: hypothetical protein V7L20_07515 [Nostoc sp.]